jgi:8-oxo-dGTP pyrophosphatase MutT (NUDIX family)
MTKRPQTMKSWGGFYVFPGGSLEPGDSQLSVHDFIGEADRSDVDRAYYVAAARELFEEVGILLCTEAEGGPVYPGEDKWLGYRRRLVEREISFADILKAERLRLNLDSLRYFGHRVTPAIRRYRFDTRFFLAELPEGQSPLPDPDEIDGALWLTPAEAIEANEQGKMEIARPTLACIRTLSDYQLNGGPCMMPDRLSESEG